MFNLDYIRQVPDVPILNKIFPICRDDPGIIFGNPQPPVRYLPVIHLKLGRLHGCYPKDLWLPTLTAGATNNFSMKEEFPLQTVFAQNKVGSKHSINA